MMVMKLVLHGRKRMANTGAGCQVRRSAVGEVEARNRLSHPEGSDRLHAANPEIPADSSDQPFLLEYPIGARDVTMGGLELIADHFDRGKGIAVFELSGGDVLGDGIRD